MGGAASHRVWRCTAAALTLSCALCVCCIALHSQEAQARLVRSILEISIFPLFKKSACSHRSEFASLVGACFNVPTELQQYTAEQRGYLTELFDWPNGRLTDEAAFGLFKKKFVRPHPPPLARSDQGTRMGSEPTLDLLPIQPNEG